MTYSDLYIQTERLILRPFTMEDLDAAYSMNLDPEVSKYTGDGGVVSRNEMKRRFVEDVFGDYEKHGFGRLAVELKGESKFIGFSGLKYIEEIEEVDLGYRFMKKYWGQGIASESAKASIDFGFKALNLQRIIATVLPDNKASISVLKKLHFELESEYIEAHERVLLYVLQKN